MCPEGTDFVESPGLKITSTRYCSQTRVISVLIPGKTTNCIFHTSVFLHGLHKHIYNCLIKDGKKCFAAGNP